MATTATDTCMKEAPQNEYDTTGRRPGFSHVLHMRGDGVVVDALVVVTGVVKGVVV